MATWLALYSSILDMHLLHARLLRRVQARCICKLDNHISRNRMPLRMILLDFRSVHQRSSGAPSLASVLQTSHEDLCSSITKLQYSTQFLVKSCYSPAVRSSRRARSGKSSRLPAGMLRTESPSRWSASLFSRSQTWSLDRVSESLSWSIYVGSMTLWSTERAWLVDTRIASRTIFCLLFVRAAHQ